MSRALPWRRRPTTALVALLAVASSAVLLDGGANVRAQSAPGPVGVESQIGAVSGSILLGPARQGGAPGETWALSDVDATNRQPKTVDGAELPSTRQYVLRYRPAEGWRYVQAPQDESGRPFAGTIRADGRVTAPGGLLFVADDPSRPDGEQRVVLTRDATGPTRVLPRPGTDVVRPSAGGAGAETLSPTAMAARATGDGRTEAFLGLSGPALQSAIARWDGGAWSREPICVAGTDPADPAAPPAGCSAADTLEGSAASLTVVALATTEGGDAWMLAHADAAAERGLVLFRRDGDGADARWRLRDLGAPRFAAAATPADGVSGVRAVAGGHALTATTDGVWIDGLFRVDGEDRGVVLRVTGSGTRTWCDGAPCDAALGYVPNERQRSQAFADGTRVVGPVGATNDRWATFDGTSWSVAPAFGDIGRGIAFTSRDEGWLGEVHLTRERPASPVAAWSIPVRRPLTSIVSAPGAAGDIGTPALAVGMDGNVVRYTPGQGWDSEVRLTGAGVARDDLRGVAWPDANTSFAVGDAGAMWRWRRATGLWESDPAKPYDFVGDLTGVAFQPGDPERGFAVGRDGVLLRYGKSWEPMALPEALATSGPGRGRADVFGVAFAGSQALAAVGSAGVIVEDGAGWRVDEGVDALLQRIRTDGAAPRIFAVAGLPDGGAVAVGSTGDNQGLVLERDGAGTPWRFSDQPLTGTAVAASAFREDGRVRALVSVTPRVWPTVDDLQIPVTDPALPAPRRTGLSLPVDGYLQRETAAGWRDEERTRLRSPTADVSRKSDPVLGILADAAGRGWTVGGWSGATDSVGRGPLPDEPPAEELQTASVGRYDPAGPQVSTNVGQSPPAMAAGRARLLVGGGARCLGSCAGLAPLDIAPDRTLARALGLAGALGVEADGPRALIYTGGRLPSAAAGAAPAAGPELSRFASLAGASTLPFLGVAGPSDVAGGTGAFRAAFAGFPAPFGAGPAGAGVRPVAVGGAGSGGARTHYAVDVDTLQGAVRVVVIDNAAGSLAAADAAGDPVEDQASWLTAVLADARAKSLPVIAAGSRSLNATDDSAATDAARVASLLRDGGASAYVFDGGGRQARTRIPSNSSVTIPSFSSGTLGYRERADLEGRGVPGLLLLELDLAARDATTNRAPVDVRLVPALDDLAIDAIDGRLLDRSRPALFQGLGRAPRAGSTSDPYVALPSPLCAASGRERCATTRIDPEVTFSSSDPDIVDFVRIDPTSTNPRKPYVDPATDKPVADASSGLVCPFNAGTATISISSGGLTYRTTVTVRDGSVLRPCGTVPLSPSRFPAAAAAATPPPPPPAPPPATPASTPTVDVPLPAPAPLPLAPPAAPAPAASSPSPSPAPAPPPTPMAPVFVAPVLAPPLAVPPPPAAASPAPPPGTSGASINVPVSQPVTQAERQKDEEVAEESSKAYARYEPVGADRGGLDPTQAAAMVALVIVGAAAGGTALGARRRRDHPIELAEVRTRSRRPR